MIHIIKVNINIANSVLYLLRKSYSSLNDFPFNLHFIKILRATACRPPRQCGSVVSSPDSRVRLPGFRFQLYHLKAAWPWKSYFTSLLKLTQLWLPHLQNEDNIPSPPRVIMRIRGTVSVSLLAQYSTSVATFLHGKRVSPANHRTSQGFGTYGRFGHSPYSNPARNT